MNKLFKYIFIFNLCLIVCACTAEKISKEEKVGLYIDKVTEAVEKRRVNEISMLIDEDYGDFKALDKGQLLNLVRRYFFMHENIHLLSKIDHMVFHGDEKVQVTLYVAMAGNVISDISVLSSLRAKIYRFELSLVYDESWLLQLAEWQRSNLKDMMQSINTIVETI